MNAFIAIALGAVVVLGVWPSHAGTKALDLYGTTMAFDVFRDGTLVGEHTVAFSNDGADLLVDTQFRIAIKFLMFTAYTLDYTSSSQWRDGKLNGLKARTNDDGTVGIVTAERLQNEIKIIDPSGAVTVASDILPTNHWNVAVTKSTAVLNTITGKVNNVEMIDLGTETVVAEGVEIDARRWMYSGDLTNEVWYDAEGRWVKMLFEGKDGSSIEYVCTRCLGDSQSTARR